MVTYCLPSRSQVTGCPTLPAPSLELPQRLAGLRIERDELAGEPASEHDVARRDQRAGEVRALIGDRPFGLAGQRVNRARV